MQSAVTGFADGLDDLLGAIQMGHDKDAAAMLEADTNLVRAQFQNKRVLHEAAAAGNLTIVKRALELGADINEPGDTLSSGGSQKTALHWAIYRNHPDVCKVLLEAGANPNIMAFGFDTSLHLAFSENREEMAGWLLDYGADPFQGKLYSNDETTPFELDITKSGGRLVPRMLGQEPKNPLGTKSLQKPGRSTRPKRGVKTAAEVLAAHGDELLAAAATRGELEAVQALFQAGVTMTNSSASSLSLLQSFALSSAGAARSRPSLIGQWHNAQDQLKADYITHAEPQFMASLRSQETGLAARVADAAPERWQKILKLLIQHGANYDALAATALGDTNQMTRLVSANKSVAQARDCNGETPLHWAVNAGQLSLVAFWIQSGAPLAATNSAGQTALHIAAANGKIDLVKALLAAQSPTGIRDTNGWTPLDAAIQAKQTESIHLLLGEKSASPHPERGLAITLHEAAATGNIAALVALLESETKLEARNELGLTPLQVAVTQGHLAAAALLVDKGADIKLRDPEGNSLLHQIFLQEQFTVHDRPPTNWLQQLPASPHKEEFIKYLTVGEYEQGPNEILQGTSFLLACGLDAKAVNHAGQTVMQLVTDGKTGRGVFFFDGDREKLFKLLGGAGGNIDQRDAEGNTALHRLANAVDANEVDRMKALIAGGANVNATNNLGQTPLHKAAERIWGWDLNEDGDNEPFQLLVKSKANVNLRDNQGRTPLDVLASADTSFKDEATALLVQAGAKLNQQDPAGLTPVHQLLKSEWPWFSVGESLQKLADAGADFSAKDNEGKTPLHYLANMRHQDPLFFIRGVDKIFIAAKVDFNARDHDGNTPLHFAAQSDYLKVFDWLVKQGASLDATNNLGQTPRLLAARNRSPFAHSDSSVEFDIFAAIRADKPDAAERILQADARLANTPDQFKQTPLRSAAMLQRTNLVTRLEKYGATWDAASAVMLGRAEVLRKLIAEKSSVATNTANGKSLLHFAAGAGDEEIVQMLLAAKVDAQAVDQWGLSPLGRARLRQHPNVVSRLRAEGARENFFDAVFLGDAKLVAAFLVQNPALAKLSSPMKATPVEIAAAAGREEVLKLLLRQGASANAPLPPTRPGQMPGGMLFSGRTPLILAAFFKQPASLEILIGAGADLNQADSMGFTPLHWAIFNGAEETAAGLLKHHAEVNQATAQVAARPGAYAQTMRGPVEGETPLHLAIMLGKTNTAQWLLKSGADANAVNGRLLTPLDQAEMTGIFSLSPGLFMGRESLNNLLEPLAGQSQPMPRLMRHDPELQKIMTAMIEAAGGKHSPPQPSFPGQPQFNYPR